MTAGDRFKGWIDGLAGEWKDRLQGWFASWVSLGANLFAESAEPIAQDMMKDAITRIANIKGIPPEYKTALLDSLTHADWQRTSSGWFWYLFGILPSILSSGRPFANLVNYDVELLQRTYRLDPDTIIKAWLRDKPQYAPYFTDLREKGWSEDRIDTLKELAKIIPPLADMVRFADFSALDPEVIEAWKEFYTAPDWISKPMELLGITNEGDRDWANKYWFSHWRQPGRYELGDMYRRGLMGDPLIGSGDYGGAEGEGEAEATIKLAYKTMGYSAFWQGRLLQLVREIPTRVDVRRWWDMRTIDEAELRSIYQRQGYFGKDLDNYVLWTKVYVAFPDLMSRWTNGWINEADVRAELAALGMPTERIETMIQTKIKPAGPARVAGEKELTKAEITKGVKKGVISWAEGIELLVDLGYDEDEADYILTINIEAMEGSPENMEEFRDITQKYRRATGISSKPVTDALKKAATDLAEITKEVESLRRAVKVESDKLVDDEAIPPEASKRLDEVRVALHRAEAVKAAAQVDYNALVAEWKFGGEK